MTQYRVAFQCYQNTNGNIMKKEFSSQWYDTLEECDKWSYEMDAEIVTRQYESEVFPWEHYTRTVGDK